jgi:hypothetical protein
MKLKEEWRHRQKRTRVNHWPTLIPLRALARRSGRFPPLPYPPPRFLKYSILAEEKRKTFNFVTVLIRCPFGKRIPAAPCQLDAPP